LVDEAAEQLRSLIDPNDLKVVYQPIVDLADQQIFACEALARSLRDENECPSHLFRRAALAGKTGVLGRVLRQLIVRTGIDLPLFVNIHPFELNEPWLLDENDPIFTHPHRIYLEITETMPLGSFDEFKHALDSLRARPNVHFVVDDLGAGFSNLRRISDLAPSIVKIDKNLITGLPESQRQRRPEVIMIIKTRASLQERVAAAVRESHPFETPAILFLPASGGDKNYVNWILEETAGAT
jgi:EAL domain-containing protein (putative c-di-GMP-specific phosphodiesterase class I)